MNTKDNSGSKPAVDTQPPVPGNHSVGDHHGHGQEVAEPSRRRFLKTSVTSLAAGAVVGSGLAGDLLAAPLHVRTPDKKELKFINVQDYGATPAASPSHNVIAFQSAIDKAARLDRKPIVFVPAGTYETDNPIYMRDYVTLIGEGASSHIKNIAVKGQSTHAIMMGDYHGKSFLGGKFLSIKPALKYSLMLFFKSPEHSRMFSPGDLIILQSEEGFRGDHRPLFQEINEVTAVGPDSVKLKYPLHDNLDGSNPKVQRSGHVSNMSIRNNVAKIVKKAGLRDLKISSAGSWMALGGAFECKIENLELDSAGVLNINGFARSVMRNIKARYWRRNLHLAYYCHHSLIENVQATYREGYPGAPGFGIGIGEGAHHNTCRNIQINSDDPGGYRTLVGFGNSNYNEVINLRAKLRNPPDLYIVEFRGHRFKCRGNVVTDARIDWGGKVRDIVKASPRSRNVAKQEQAAKNKVSGYFNGDVVNFES